MINIETNTTYPQVIGTREDRGKAIAEKNGQIIRINDNTYKVKSQSSDTLYDITSTEIGWKCSCPDHQTRGLKCKHIHAVEISFNLREEVKKTTTIQPLKITDCIFCHSINIKKFGIRHNKDFDVQKYQSVSYTHLRAHETRHDL